MMCQVLTDAQMLDVIEGFWAWAFWSDFSRITDLAYMHITHSHMVRIIH